MSLAAARLGTLAPVAGRDSSLAIRGEVRVMAGVVPVGGSVVHAARSRRRYVMSTVGAIAADGVEVAAGAGALIERSGSIQIAARQSTEVVIVETA
jgi:redox-sensitive bicupin YhaK (pirin superfamily)